jgi:thiol-disulfide isomerase/thioredoxin
MKQMFAGQTDRSSLRAKSAVRVPAQLSVRSKKQSAARLAAAVLVTASLATGLGACAANDPLASQFKAGDNKNYIAGDGSVTEYALANRGKSVVWAGPTETGGILSSAQLSGVPVVMNYWYAGCAPCRAEAPDLLAISKKFPKVQFVGVNVRDSAATAAAFGRNFKLTWPSIIDSKSGSVALAFTGIVTPAAVPTTLVIDKQGRVSARVLGRIDKSILTTLVQTVQDEKATK